MTAQDTTGQTILGHPSGLFVLFFILPPQMRVDLGLINQTALLVLLDLVDDLSDALDFIGDFVELA